MKTAYRFALLAASSSLCSVPVQALAQSDQQAQAQPPAGTTPTANPSAPVTAPEPVESQGASSGAAAPGSPPADSGNQNQVADIVVTANRVSTSAQKTPIALTVYSSQALQNAGVRSVQALSTIDPSVNVTQSTGSAYVAIRGIASTDVTEIGDPSVPIARDGFFTNRAFSIGTSLYDIQRIEVLKGPQGTLFGRNSTGGLVSIITNKPGKDYGGYGSVDVGNYQSINAEAGVNVPLADWVQVRLSGITQYRHGYRDLTVVGLRGDDNNTKSGRASIALQPFAGFDALIQYQHDDINDVGDVTKNLPLGVVTPIGDSKTFPNYQPTANRILGDRIRWEFSYSRLPLGLTLTYAGGHDTQTWRHALDATGPSLNPLSQFIQNEHPRTWNHEVRIATRQDQPFTLQAGFFHFDEHNTVNSGVQLNSGAAAGSRLVQFNYNVFTKSNAVFGQAGYRLTDALRLTGGVRYTWDIKQRTGQSALRCDLAGIPSFLYGVIGCAGTPPTLITPSNGNIDQSRPTFHGGLDWTPTAATLVYAKYDTGYKSGGFNSNGSAPSVDYGPETLQAYEVGTKNRFLDNRLQLNLDGFYQTYNGYQASQTSAVVSSGSGVFNVGSAKIYGAEVQIVAVVPELARIDVNATYLHARFDRNIGLVTRGDSAATPADIGGNALPNAPDFVIAGGVEHDFRVGNGDVLTARVDGKYSDHFYYTVFNDADTRQAAFATGNASLTYKLAGGHYQVQAFVRNFTDHTVLANAARNYVSGFNTYEFQPPRTYGARLSFNF